MNPNQIIDSAANPPVGFGVFRPRSWHDTLHLGRNLSRWVFRGQSNFSWNLSTSLERAAGKFNCYNSLLKQRESWMLRQFQRRAHHYVPDPPKHAQRLDWLALIQHHGGPTRLLDFAHSFYVAAFFAMEMADTDAAVWAIRSEHLEKAAERYLGVSRGRRDNDATMNSRYIEVAEKVLAGSLEQELVICVEPERMNERLSAQQGTFLFPCKVGIPFESALAGTFDLSSEVFNDVPVIEYDPATGRRDLKDLSIAKVVLPRVRHTEGMWDLSSMNISSTTLFPGVDGFARSLFLSLRIDPPEEFAEIIQSNPELAINLIEKLKGPDPDEPHDTGFAVHREVPQRSTSES